MALEQFIAVVLREGVLLVEEGRGPAEDVVDLQGVGGAERSARAQPTKLALTAIAAMRPSPASFRFSRTSPSIVVASQWLASLNACPVYPRPGATSVRSRSPAAHSSRLGVDALPGQRGAHDSGKALAIPRAARQRERGGRDCVSVETSDGGDVVRDGKLVAHDGGGGEADGGGARP